MRTLRLSLTGMVFLALLGGLSLAVVAQDEEPTPITFVTGTVTEAYTYDADSGGRETFSDDLRGFEVTGGGVDLMRQVVEWSDPRLPTDLWLALDYTLIRGGADSSDGALNNATRSVLEDEAGRWVGTGRYVLDADQAFSFYVLTGERAYEGLHALLHGFPVADDPQRPWDMAYEGYILEAELTPFPDEPVPVTIEGMQVY